MVRKELRIWLGCLVICCSICGVFYRIIANDFHKVAVVDAVRLFDEFNMKKEMEGMAKTQLQQQGKQLDSVNHLLQLTRSVNKNEDEISHLVSTYNYMKAKLTEDYKQSNHDINEQVWKRLNPLLDEYGKKKKFHLIIGANGMGTVLYNDEYYDVTNDAIKYINKSYGGAN